MSKTYRGKGLIKLQSRGRGTCPSCKTRRIKLLYEIILLDGSKLRVCKRCRKKR
ncbi:MAG: hypothetical protein K0S47_115 [Herbinix sp.]|jgi:hypothetical protein|nr:hypothetical protein [Herbinix sp.]